MHRSQIHGSHILQIGIKDHVPRDTVVLVDVGKRIVNARAIQPSLANGVEQRVHRVVCQRRKLLRLLVKACFEATLKSSQAGSLRDWDRKERLPQIPLQRSSLVQAIRGPSVR